MAVSPQLVLGLVAGACNAAGPAATRVPAADVVVERRLEAMGTWLELRVAAADRATALAASEAAVRAVAAVEARLSTWRDDTELARLNRAPVGERVALSAELARDLEGARELWRASGGAFDPGVGALVAAWGLRSGGRRPTDAEVETALAAGGLAGFELEGRSAVRTHPAASLEEGGFGKGVGLDAAGAALAGAGATWGALDLGGQVALVGATPEQVFALADPRDRQRPVLELTVEGGSFATSGSSERGIVVDGVRRAHVLDPRSGRPADDFGSVTVWAADATTADALSTALFVMGPERGLAWAAAHAGVEALAIVVREDGLEARATEGWRGRVRPMTELELRFVEGR